jgi:hypothetical protein
VSVRARTILWGLLLLVAGLAGAFLARLTGRERIARTRIRDPEEHTTVDDSGAVRSVQAADLMLPEYELEDIWTPMHLERLARTYWRYITRISLGLLRVAYTPTERAVVLLTRPFVLLRFHAPEYEMDAERGIVRWRIKDGVLVSRQGRDDGHLQIDVQHCPSPRPGEARVHVAVEVANFYPAIASGLSLWLYQLTQSRIHVLVTHGFLRSLASLDLAPSRVGMYAGGIDDVPNPPALEPVEDREAAA